VITSPQNQTLKLVRKLHARRWRDKLGLFFAEGEDLVDAALEAGLEPVELLVAGETVLTELVAEVSTLPHPARAIAIFRREDLPVFEQRPVALALWRVGDPGNVGTLIRAADAFSASVELSPGCADPTGPKALRASAGAVFRVPLGEAAGGRCASSSSAIPPSSFSAPSGRDCRKRCSRAATTSRRSRSPGRPNPSTLRPRARSRSTSGAAGLTRLVG